MSINTTERDGEGRLHADEQRPLLGDTENSDDEIDDAWRFRSLKAVLLTNFLSATGFSLLMSTMWPYLRDMTDSAEVDSVGCATDDSESKYKARLGYVVAAFSVGQLFGGPFFGWYSTKRAYFETLVVTVVIRLLGNILYALCGGLPMDSEGKFDVLLASRLIVGFGAGSMAVCNAYITGATTQKERPAWIGFLAGTGGLGFVIGPLIGSCFGRVKTQHAALGGGVTITFSYTTAPAYTAAFFALINIWVLVRMFKDCSIVKRGDDSKKDHGVSASRKDRDYVAIAVLLAIYFGAYFVLSIFETIGLPLTMDEFSWSPADADIYNGIISGVGGMQNVFFFVTAKNFAVKHGERKVLGAGLVLIVLSQICAIPFAGPRMRSNDYCCDHWCSSDPALPFGQYIVSAILINAGFPLAMVMIFTLYSYVLGPFHQGAWMGIINGVGSLARIVGPIMITAGYSFGGPRMVFSTAAFFTVGALTRTPDVFRSNSKRANLLHRPLYFSYLVQHQLDWFRLAHASKVRMKRSEQ
mmetsp:Transcript_14989/g.38491  ORF Transcript_14989/g.38491 Transcript_14989/m.38491 type:complete len:526 (-) Transcript_14989:1325-2902(-)